MDNVPTKGTNCQNRGTFSRKQLREALSFIVLGVHGV